MTRFIRQFLEKSARERPRSGSPPGARPAFGREDGQNRGGLSNGGATEPSIRSVENPDRRPHRATKARLGHWLATLRNDKLSKMIRRLFVPLATAAGVALCAAAAAPAVAKDKPAAEGAAGDAKADKKKPGKAEAEKPSDAKKAEVKAVGSPKSAGSSGSKPADAKKADAKKPAEGRKAAEAKSSEAKSSEAKKGDLHRMEDGEGAAAKDPKASKGKPGKDAKEKPVEKDRGAAAKAPVAVGSFGDWNAMTAHGGKDKTCYALAEPKERQPAKLQRDKAYVFISTRPGEGVRNEVAIILGFPLKDGGAATAEIDGASFELVTKGTNAWVKNPAKEKEFVDALRNGSKLVVKAPSIKGNVTTDLYSLKGLAEALARVQKECQ
jgi:hypothetical protein